MLMLFRLLVGEQKQLFSRKKITAIQKIFVTLQPKSSKHIKINELC